MNFCLGSESEIIHKSAQQDDPQRRKPDIRKAIRHFGWKPKVIFPGAFPDFIMMYIIFLSLVLIVENNFNTYFLLKDLNVERIFSQCK